MVLRDGLTDSDIPRRDRTREAIIQYWRTSFEALKSELAVGNRVPSFQHTTDYHQTALLRKDQHHS
jgi:hypothetical protein